MADDFMNINDEHRRLSMRVKKDVFYEMSVFSQSEYSRLFSGILFTLSIVCAIGAFALLFVGGLYNWVMYIFAGILGFLCYVFYWLSGRTKVEYDYTITNGTVDIAKIYNDKKRKKLVSVESSEILDMRSITSDVFQEYFSDRSIKKANMFLNKGPHLYYMLFIKDDKKVAVIFEPDQQFVEYMKLYNPTNIIA